jgi:hypothetical protein
MIELLTTPQLHYTVRCYNDDGLYGHYTEAGYFNKLCTAFQKLIEVEFIYLSSFFCFLIICVDDTGCEM